jgi:hypothetical protein
MVRGIAHLEAIAKPAAAARKSKKGGLEGRPELFD